MYNSYIHVYVATTLIGVHEMLLEWTPIKVVAITLVVVAGLDPLPHHMDTTTLLVGR